MATYLDNSDPMHKISQPSKGSMFESLRFLEEPDGDYLFFLQNIFCKSFKESENFEDLYCKDLNGDDHFENLVEKSENEVLDDDDPQYKLFLSHVKGNGKSFTFEMKEENGLCKIIEYDKEELIDDRHDLKKNKNKDNVVERKRKRSRSEPKKTKNVKKSCLGYLALEKGNTMSHKDTSTNQRVSRLQPKSNKDGLGKMAEEHKSHSVGRHRTRREQHSFVDKDYQHFLSCAEIVTGRISYPHNSDKNIVYDEEVNLGSVLDHEVKRSRRKSSGKTHLEEEGRCQKLGSLKTYDLKGKLMDLLRNPFDDQEYNTLWHFVTQKSYKFRHRELQHGRERSVPTKIKAKSYLQQHKALRRAIEAVSDDKFKQLNILRGFSFWLQHLPWGGIRKPWTDASCLAVMPGSR